MHVKQYLALALAISCTGSAFAATSTTIEITGKALPAVCNVTASQAKLDLGDVLADGTGKVASIRRSMGTLNFNCSAPTQLILALSSTAPGFNGNKNTPSGWMQGGRGLSSLQLYTSKIVVNSESASLIAMVNNNGFWGPMSAGQGLALDGGDFKTSFGKANGTAPVAVSTASFDIEATLGEITKANFAAGEISANQTLTFEIKYL